MNSVKKVIAVALALLLMNFIPVAQGATRVVNPKVLSVGVLASTATVKWSSPKLPKGAFFEIELSSTFPTPFVRVLRSVDTTITNTLNPYTKYSVRVKSKGIAKGAWSNSKGFTTLGDPVNNVNIVKTTHTSIEVAWEESVGATGYEVTLNNNVPKRTVTPNFTFSGLKPGTVGQFSVRPVSGLNKGEPTPFFEFSTLTSGPTSLKSSQITTNSFLLEWIGVEGATSYNVYKNDVFLASSKATSYAVNSLLPDVAADYWVEAVFTDVVTEASEKINVKTEQEVLAVPTVPTVSTITSVAATVSWALAPKATSYKVTLFDSTGQTVVATKSINFSITSTQFTGLAPLTGYSVGIVVVNGNNVSKQSSLAIFTTLKTELTGLVTSNITTTGITLGWSSIPAATTYEVLRDGLVIASSIAPTTLSYGFSSLAPGVTYRLGVRATYLNGSQVSMATELKEISATTLIDTSYKPAINTNPVITLPYAANPIVAATLTSTSGIWTSVPAVSSYTYQWQRSADGADANYSDISGATGLTYVVTSLEVGFRLRIKVTATNTNGTGTVFSAATLVGTVGYNVSAPIVRGNFVVGQTLEASDGTWISPYAIVIGYQWLSAGSAIVGAVSSTYTPISTNIGAAITVTVTASTVQGSLSVTSPARGTVLAINNSVAPSISGSVNGGGTLTLSTGTWLNSPSLTQQWQSSSDGLLWNAISGATASTYVITDAEAGLYIRAQVFGSKTYTTTYSVTANSASTVRVPNLVNLTNSVSPVVSGAWTVGTTLSTSNGTWSTSGTFTYLWQSSSDNSTWGVTAGSATSSSYVVLAGDSGKYLRVQVTNSTTSGVGIAYSASRSKIGSPYNTALPTISGTLRIGSVQTVTTGSAGWDNSPTSQSLQWQSSTNGISWIDIGGATSSTYTPTFNLANSQIRVSCTATNATGSTTVNTAVIQNFLPPQATAIPTTSDIATVSVGSVISITSPGIWPGTSSGYNYQWQKSSDGGTAWTNISAATGSTYTVMASELGYNIRLQVTLITNTGSSSAYSLSSAAISP